MTPTLCRILACSACDGSNGPWGHTCHYPDGYDVVVDAARDALRVDHRGDALPVLERAPLY